MAVTAHIASLMRMRYSARIPIHTKAIRIRRRNPNSLTSQYQYSRFIRHHAEFDCVKFTNDAWDLIDLINIFEYYSFAGRENETIFLIRIHWALFDAKTRNTQVNAFIGTVSDYQRHTSSCLHNSLKTKHIRQLYARFHLLLLTLTNLSPLSLSLSLYKHNALYMRRLANHLIHLHQPTHTYVSHTNLQWKQKRRQRRSIAGRVSSIVCWNSHKNRF